MLKSIKMVIGIWKKFPFLSLEVWLTKSMQYPIQTYGEKEDTLMWRFSLDGDFNMASAYQLTIVELPKPPPILGLLDLGLRHLTKN